MAQKHKHITRVCISDTGYETLQGAPVAGPTPRLHPASGATSSMLIHVHVFINEKSYPTIIPRFPHLCMHCVHYNACKKKRGAVDRGFTCFSLYVGLKEGGRAQKHKQFPVFTCMH